MSSIYNSSKSLRPNSFFVPKCVTAEGEWEKIFKIAIHVEEALALPSYVMVINFNDDISFPCNFVVVVAALTGYKNPQVNDNPADCFLPTTNATMVELNGGFI